MFPLRHAGRPGDQQSDEADDGRLTTLVLMLTTDSSAKTIVARFHDMSGVLYGVGIN